MEHNTSGGEGVGITDYTLIKMALQSPFPGELAQFDGKKKGRFNQTDVFPLSVPVLC
jgi:hypothetical protein